MSPLVGLEWMDLTSISCWIQPSALTPAFSSWVGPAFMHGPGMEGMELCLGLGALPGRLKWVMMQSNTGMMETLCVPFLVINANFLKR